MHRSSGIGVLSCSAGIAAAIFGLTRLASAAEPEALPSAPNLPGPDDSEDPRVDELQQQMNDLSERLKQSEEDRQRIFDPFLHAQPAKHHTSAGPDSAGLGLYIARGLIELHGGLVTVDSQPDMFTEFTVLLPFKQV